MRAIVGADNMDHYLSQRQLLFNKNPQKISQGKAARESQETAGTGQMLHHLHRGDLLQADIPLDQAPTRVKFNKYALELEAKDEMKIQKL